MRTPCHEAINKSALVCTWTSPLCHAVSFASCPFTWKHLYVLSSIKGFLESHRLYGQISFVDESRLVCTLVEMVVSWDLGSCLDRISVHLIHMCFVWVLKNKPLRVDKCVNMCVSCLCLSPCYQDRLRNHSDPDRDKARLLDGLYISEEATGFVLKKETLKTVYKKNNSNWSETEAETE